MRAFQLEDYRGPAGCGSPTFVPEPDDSSAIIDVRAIASTSPICC